MLALVEFVTAFKMQNFLAILKSYDKKTPLIYSKSIKSNQIALQSVWISPNQTDKESTEIGLEFLILVSD